jgi:uncharacterized repeat protein (TIGR03803 family)
MGGLIIDANGTFYGAVGGFTVPHGSVYKLRRLSDGRWVRTTLYSFSGGVDGAYPKGNLILDEAGNLYGTTAWGGATGNGAIFELTPTAQLPWEEKVLYNFSSFPDGAGVSSALIVDGAGNFYGTTAFGGLGHGTVFRLKHNPDGTWTESVLYRFTGATDGNGPSDGLGMDADGNIFGTTFVGGSHNAGTLFELSPGPNDTWTLRLLHSFCAQANCADGQNPTGVVLDARGNIYGMTNTGGIVPCWTFNPGCGIVYQHARGQNGTWTFRILHSFCAEASCLDGARPATTLISDNAGSLYGTTLAGGNANQGTVFKLSHPTGSPWMLKVLYSFCTLPRCADGQAPGGPLTRDGAGNLFGPAIQIENGLIFELTNATSTTLATDLNPSIYGQKVTLSATVTSSGSITPTGKVNIMWSGHIIGSATLDGNAVATLSKSYLNADTYPLTAAYVGDVANLRSISNVLNQVVLQTTTSAALTSSPNPSTQGQAVTFTATISSPTVIPAGPVTFTTGKTVLGSAQLSAGKAKLTISSLAVGSTKVTATYSGNSNIAKSSASVTQTVR